MTRNVGAPIQLRLYLTGRSVSAERARAAIADLTCRLVAERGSQAVVTDIIDVLDAPESAIRDAVFATPTLVRVAPGPMLRLFGDLSSADEIMISLGLTTTVAVPAASGEDTRPWPRPLTHSIMS